MQIRRMILKGVRNFVDFDCLFEDSWSGRVPDSLLLIGPNGSGKTTLLNVIADLWQFLAHCLHEEVPSPAGIVLQGMGLAAVEIIGLEKNPIWVYFSVADAFRELVAKEAGSYRVGASFMPGTVAGETVLFETWTYSMPGVTDATEFAKPFDRSIEVEEKHIQFLNWLQKWEQRLTENILGKRQDLSNIVYLESETRIILPLSEKFSVQPESEEFRWLARYEPTTSRKGSLQNYLYNLKVVDEAAFENIVEEANKFLIGKRLNGFDRRTGDLMVEIDGGGRHPITDLSSGEKQVLLMLATITRWLRPGGIVLIDEPDLHLHSSLTTAFVAHLRRMVASKNGQLVIASHAPELLQDFTTSHRVELGTLSEVVR